MTTNNDRIDRTEVSGFSGQSSQRSQHGLTTGRIDDNYFVGLEKWI